MLKESARERINAVYSTKEQCRKEFQDEITRLRNQFQLVCTRILYLVILTLIKYFFLYYSQTVNKLSFDLVNIVSPIYVFIPYKSNYNFL